MRRQASSRLAAVALLGAISTGPAMAREEDQESRLKAVGGLTFVDELELTLVNVFVHVTDKRGNAITDLTQEDFKIFQDGTEKPISNFALYTQEIIDHLYASQEPLPGPTPTPIPELAEIPPPRPVYIVLYVDHENIRPLDRNRVLRNVREWVRETLAPPAQMMVVAYDRSLKVLQPFTDDPDQITAALLGMRMHVGGRTERDNARRDVMDRMAKYKDQEMSSRRYDSQRGGDHTIWRLIKGFADEEANALLFTVDALREVVTMLAGLPGKKSVVYISNGLPMVAGIDLFYEFQDVYNDSSILTMITTYDRTRLFESLAASANAQGVNLYTIGAGGLEMGGIGSAENSYAQNPLSASIGSNNYLDSLRFMARETGGLAVVNTNDITAGLGRIGEDVHTYYWLGYTLNMSGGDKVHKIKVAVPGHPEYTVRHRRRFVEKSIETRVQDTVTTALVFEVDDNPMQIELDIGSPAPAAEDRWTLPFHLSFPLRKVALLPEGEEYIGRLVLFLAARDARGKQSDLIRQEHRVRIPVVDYEEAQLKRFGIDGSLLMEPGSFTISIGLLDQVTRQASYTYVKTTIEQP